MEREPLARTTIDFLISRLRDARDTVGTTSYQTFRQFVELANAALNHTGQDSWQALLSGWEPALPLFEQVLGELMVAAQQRPFHDMLGPAYMQLGRADRAFGQFFTPWTVARALARIQLGDLNITEYSPTSPLHILDPACGSGTLLLASAHELPRPFVESGAARFFGIDLDPLCVEMTRLNLQLHGLGHLSVAHQGPAPERQHWLSGRHLVLRGNR